MASVEPATIGQRFPTVEIRNDGNLGIGTHVTIDGRELKNVRRLELELDVAEVNHVRVDYLAMPARVQLEAKVEEVYSIELYGPRGIHLGYLERSEGLLATGRGSSVSAALRDLADQLERSPTPAS